MTQPAQAFEAALNAETRAEKLFTEVLDKLHGYNARLFQLHDEIKAAQPKASGAVCLELYPCGAFCLGCPHPRWMRYEWVPDERVKLSGARMVAINLDAKKRDPVRQLVKKDAHYAALVALIREAKKLIEDRSALLAAMRTLRGPLSRGAAACTPA